MADEQGQHARRGPERRVAVVVVHGVGDTEPGWALNQLVDTLEERSGGQVEAEPFSAVYRLSSPPVVDGDPEDRFPAYARRVSVAGVGTARFYDLHWADLTHTLPGRLNAFLGAFRIIFESHHFIDAMLPKDAGPLTRRLRRILILAAAVLRGPIVGISACLVLIGLALYALWNWLPAVGAYLARPGQPPDHEAALVWLVMGLMLSLAVAGLVLFYRRARLRETEWNDVTIAVVAGALFVAGYTWLLYKFPDVQFIRGIDRDIDRAGTTFSVCTYIDRFYYISQSLRVLWCVLVLLALALIVWLFWSARGSATEARAGAAMAATSVVVLQSALWLTLLSAFAVPILRDTAPHGIPACSLSGLYVSFAGTATLLVCVALVLVLTYWTRAMLARMRFVPAASRARFMPRMLIGGAVTLAVLVGAVAQVGMFAIAYLAAFFGNNFILRSLEGVLTDQAQAYYDIILGHRDAFGGAVGLIALGASALITFGLGTAIHIARDLIDHQYSPRLGYSHYLLPKRWRVGPAKPRRLRIGERLNTLVREVICRDAFDDLIFVVHSQGSVVIYDYLRSGSTECQQLMCVRPHMVTFGSPLGHLYAFYYKEYARLEDEIASFKSKLSSWINLYRVDDFVGREIGGRTETFVENRVMEAGGHTDYWTERWLSDVVLERIRTPCAPQLTGHAPNMRASA